MPICFEARFRFARPIPTDQLEQEFKAATFAQPLQLFKPHGMNTVDGWLAVKSCGYVDYAEAKTSGALFHDGLLIVAAKQQVGVEFYLRSGPDGIHVYSGQIQLSDPGLPMPTPLTHDKLKEMMAAALESAAALSANQRIAAELLNDSLFNMSPEASFLLRVSAVEALCPQAIQTDAFKAMVDGVRTSIPEDASPADRDQIERALKTLAERQSIRSAYMAKIRKLIGNDVAKKFDGLYAQRSKLVHEGIGRGTVGGSGAEALEIGLSLLLADMKQP